MELPIIQLPSYHSCGEKLEEKCVPVDERVLSLNPYPVSYCSGCDVYIFNEFESGNPEKIGEHVAALQIETNLRKNDSPYSMAFLKKLNS